MEYEWNDAKAAANLKKHGVSFHSMEGFDWTTALVVKDERFNYGEDRWLALGMIGEQLCSLAFTVRGDRIRIISLRAASQKERRLYSEQDQG